MGRHNVQSHKKQRVWRALERRGVPMVCFWCEEAVSRGAAVPSQRATLDHIVPRSAGWSNRIDNFVIACMSCNHNRKDTAAHEFLRSTYLTRRRQFRGAL